MSEEQLADVWMLFKEYVDGKQVEIAAEKFVDLMADYGVSDQTFKDCLGTDSVLDGAIGYYLEIDADAYLDGLDEWDE